jgi:uncharacterized membrane protein YkvA (DUF1232 family)
MAKRALFDFTKGQKTPVKTAMIGGLVALSALYLFNPGMGIFELIPDNIPFLGNIDEFTAVMLLVSSLKYFGIDLMGMFTGSSSTSKTEGAVEPVYEPPAK